MTLNRSGQRVIASIFFAALAVLYGIAWLSPAIGLFHDDAIYLVTAKAISAGHGYRIESLPEPILQTKYPPLFPALLALFTLVSANAQWLKLLPLACTAAWLIVTRRLLIRMGASQGDALVLVALTAASPLVLFLSTNLLSETLFALLITATLLMLIEEHAFAAAILAGLAVMTRTAGGPVIVACIVTLVVRRRFRGAVIFAAVSVLLVAPWLGWSLAHVPHDSYYGANNYVASNIATGLAANEKFVVLTRNFLLLLATPLSLLTGFNNVWAVGSTLLLLVVCFYKQRQLVPDLFLGLYCLMLLGWAWPPERFVAPVLPLVLWIVWRVIRRTRMREALAACVIIVAMLALWADVRRIPQPGGQTGNNWAEMRKMFTFIKANTPRDSVLLANLDPLFYLNTGRKAIRGFAPNGFGLYYATTQAGVTPDQLSTAIQRSQVNYVVLTPDRDFAESASFHSSVEALERGGVLQPVAIAGISPEYRLLQVTR